MKAHVGADTQPGLIHTVIGTAAMYMTCRIRPEKRRALPKTMEGELLENIEQVQASIRQG